MRSARPALAAIVATILTAAGAISFAQQTPPAGARGGRRGVPIGVPPAPLGDGPFVFDTAEQHKVRVVVVTKGLANPWSFAFLPDGNILVTERGGQLRLVRHGVLDPQPVSGAPQSRAIRLGGLMDVVLHPKFAENRLIYLTYSKPGENGLIATALARGQWAARFFARAWRGG